MKETLYFAPFLEGAVKGPETSVWTKSNGFLCTRRTLLWEWKSVIVPIYTGSTFADTSSAFEIFETFYNTALPHFRVPSGNTCAIRSGHSLKSEIWSCWPGRLSEESRTKRSPSECPVAETDSLLSIRHFSSSNLTLRTFLKSALTEKRLESNREVCKTSSLRHYVSFRLHEEWDWQFFSRQLLEKICFLWQNLEC